MLKKLSLDKTKGYEKCIAIEQIAKMLADYIKGIPYPLEIGAEQGDIPTWDDFVIKNYDSSTTYVQVKRQTTPFCSDKDMAVRGVYNQGKSKGEPRKLSPFDEVFKALAEATLDDCHLKDSFWICLPESEIPIKEDLSVREFRKVRESIKAVTQGIELQNQASKDQQTQNVFDWLHTWCGFNDWNHVVKALKLLTIKTMGYESEINERTKDILTRIFKFADVDLVYSIISDYLDLNSTYAGAFRPRELLGKLQQYLTPQIERWTMFKAEGSSWAIFGINDLEQNYIERISKIIDAFWNDTPTYRCNLKIIGKYPENCEVAKCLMRLSLHLEGLMSTASTHHELWVSDIKKAVGETLGCSEDDFRGMTVIPTSDEYNKDRDSFELNTLNQKDKYAEELSNKMHLAILKKVDEKLQLKFRNMESSDLRDNLEKCWNDWHEKLENDEKGRKKFFVSILHPESEGKSILGELRVGGKTVALITDAIFLNMVVSIAFSDNGTYHWSHINSDLKIRTIGLRYWSGSAGSSKEVIEIGDYREVGYLLAQENEEVIILSGTYEAVENLLGEDMANNSLHNGLLSDCKRPQLLVSYSSKMKRLIDQGDINAIKGYLQCQIERYNAKTSISIESIIK